MSRSAGKEYGGQQLFLGSPSEAVRYFRSMAANDQSNIFPEDLSEQLTNAGCEHLTSMLTAVRVDRSLY